MGGGLSYNDLKRSFPLVRIEDYFPEICPLGGAPGQTLETVCRIFTKIQKKVQFFYKKNPLSPPCPHNCSLQQGRNAAFVASCSPSSPATISGAQAPVFPRVPKPKFMQHPKAKSQNSKTKHATRKAHMRKMFFSNTYVH